MHFTLVLLKLNRRLHNLVVVSVSQFQNTCCHEAWAVITGLRFQTSSRTLPTSTSHRRLYPYLWAFSSAWLPHFTSFLKIMWSNWNGKSLTKMISWPKSNVPCLYWVQQTHTSPSKRISYPNIEHASGLPFCLSNLPESLEKWWFTIELPMEKSYFDN